jgi:CysZ protein
MDKLITASFKSIGSIFAPGMLGVFVSCLFTTFFVLVGFVFLVTMGAAIFSDLISDPSLSAALPWFSGMGAGLFAYFLFPGIMPVIVNFFDSKIAGVIEQKDYPVVRPISPPFWPEFWHDVRFTLFAIFLNIVVMPLYLFPVIGQIAFFALNGHLLGKEFFVMAARRYMPLEDALALRTQHGRTIFVGGIILTFLATIPLLNLFAPFWGIAVMTHLYHAFKATPKAEILLSVD